MKMKETVHKVEPQFVRECGTVPSRLSFGRLRADENFAMLESDHVSRAAHFHELPVQFAHPMIGNQQHIDFFKTRESRPSRALTHAHTKRAFCELLQRSSIHRNLALPIVNRN